MSEDFAKIFYSGGRQILAYACPGEDNGYELHQITRAAFGNVDSSMSFNVNDKAPDDFDAIASIIGQYGQEEADKFLSEILKLEESFMGSAA